MLKLFIHTWALTSEKFGFDLKAWVVAVIREGGLTWTNPCPGDSDCYDEPEFVPRNNRALSGEITTEQVQEGFGMLLKSIDDQNKKIAELEATIKSLTGA